MRARDISDFCVCFDELFDPTKGSSVGVGDGGNEVGMGNVLPLVEEHVPDGPVVGCTTRTTELIVAGVSNWGALGLAAALGVVRGGVSAADSTITVPSASAWELAHQSMVSQGIADGVSGVVGLSVDGLPWEEHENTRRLVQECVTTSTTTLE
jgi:hypothetical protein